jgi:predicted CXXCH cytochrome family protein
VPTPEEIAAHTSGERPVAKDACAWCHKSEGEVKKLLGRAGTALCNECVSLACDIFEAELGPTWR